MVNISQRNIERIARCVLRQRYYPIKFNTPQEVIYTLLNNIRIPVHEAALAIDVFAVEPPSRQATFKTADIELKRFKRMGRKHKGGKFKNKRLYISMDIGHYEDKTIYINSETLVVRYGYYG